MSKRYFDIAYQIFGVVIVFIGAYLLFPLFTWKEFLGLFLILWSNNISIFYGQTIFRCLTERRRVVINSE